MEVPKLKKKNGAGGGLYSITALQPGFSLAAAAAKLLLLCLPLCGPIEGSPPGSPVPGIL